MSSGIVLFFKQKTAYEMRISDWSSDVCSSDLGDDPRPRGRRPRPLSCAGARRRSAERRPVKTPQTLRVALGERSYDIVIGTTVLAEAGKLMRPVLRSDRVVVVTDSNVAGLHLARLQRGQIGRAHV